MKLHIPTGEATIVKGPTYVLYILQHIPTGLRCSVRRYPDGSLKPEPDFLRIGLWSRDTEEGVQAAIAEEESIFVLLEASLVTPARR